MNLTTKRMLQFMTVGAGACALSATATTTWVGDSFEGPAGTNNMPIALYQADLVNEVTGETTNLLWTATAGDQSKLVDADNSSFSASSRPMDTNTARVLELATEGQTLTRNVFRVNELSETSSVPFSTVSPVYVDTLIKFTPSEDTPTIVPGSTKVAVYVNVNSNLVVYHQTDLGFPIGLTLTNSVFTSLGIIDPATWYRLTIQMGTPSVGTACKIYVNGQALTNELTFTDGGDFGGEWFMTDNAAATLSGVAFQGTGAVDELVVADMATFPSEGGILLTLMFDTGIENVLTSGVSVASGTTVPTGTAIEINAKPWYEIDAKGALFTGGSTTNFLGTMITNIIGSVAGDNGQTNNITSKPYSDTAALSTGLSSNYPANKVSAWAINKAGGTYPLTADMTDDYLLNVPPATDAVLKINSITVAGSLATIKVGATSGLVDMTAAALNGTLVIYTTDDLTTPFDEILSFDITVETAAEVTITVPVGDGKFIKAVVQ